MIRTLFDSRRAASEAQDCSGRWPGAAVTDLRFSFEPVTSPGVFRVDLVNLDLG